MPEFDPKALIGREQELKDLREHLSNQQQVVLVNGMGGIGKTALAQTYATFYSDNYAHIAWVQHTSDDFRQDLISAEGLLHSLNIDVTGTVDELFPRVIHQLRTLKNQPNLLVIDNAFASLTKIKDQLPKQPHWHILITSREEIAGFELKELGFLSETAAIDLFKRHYTLTKLQDADIAAIVKAIDYHTLTIELLAKVAQRKRATPDELLTAIKDDITANVNINHAQGGEKVERIRSYLCSIFKADKLSEPEIHLLKQLTCLPTEFHTYEILEELLDVKEAVGFTFSEILESLKESGWLISEIKNDSYKMHQVIQLVLFTQLNVQLDDVGLLIENVNNKLSLDQSIDNPVDKFPWIPFGLILEHLFTQAVDPVLSALQNNLALRFRDFGDYQKAKIFLKKAVIYSEKFLGVESFETISCYSNLGVVLRYLGEYQSAKSILYKALCLNIKNFGEADSQTAICYSNLGLVHYSLGEFQDAETLLKKALKYDEMIHGEDHPLTAISYANLAGVHMELNNYEDAEKLFKKALNTNRKNFGEDHPSTAESYSNLGLIQHRLRNFLEAKKLLSKALLLDQKNFPEEHPVIARRSSNLGLLLADIKNYSRSIKLLQKVLNINIKNHGRTHFSTGFSYYDLSTVLYDMGDYQRAYSSINEAIYVFKQVYSVNHPILKDAYFCLESIKKKIDNN